LIHKIVYPCLFCHASPSFLGRSVHPEVSSVSSIAQHPNIL
jgi:hypothetical protein